MTKTEWNELVLGTFERCYPSTMDWLSDRPDNGAAVLSQWYVELQDYKAEDVIEAIEDIHRRHEGPAAYDRECWPAWISRNISKKREAIRLRTEWRSGAPAGVWHTVTEGDATMAAAYKACRDARTAARSRFPEDAPPYEVDAAVELAGYTAVADVLDPGRSHRVPEWGNY